MSGSITTDAIAPYLPYLRRFARAVVGNQVGGDEFVVATLEAILHDRSVLEPQLGPRAALYRVFYQVWSSGELATYEPPSDRPAESIAARKLDILTPTSRLALLLTAMEEFPASDAAAILDVSAEEFEALRGEALATLASESRARVLIIEDEPIIAMDIQSIVEGLGHSVVGVADTKDTAVAAAKATEPDLVLADIQLADGSSGIDAVGEILAALDVPVIFITAYPDRLLTGERPEPTFLVTKPFRTEGVEAAISQALFFRTPVPA